MAGMKNRVWIWLILVFDFLSLAYLATLGFGSLIAKCAMIIAPPFLLFLALRLEMNRRRRNCTKSKDSS
jgi:hypothetical protein